MQRRIGEYKIISELGQGAMARVYRARRETSKAGIPDEVAIKAFLLIYVLSGAMRGGQQIGALRAMDEQGARRAEIRKALPVNTPTLAPTGSLAEEAATGTATAQPTGVVTKPAPTVQAVQESGGGNGAPQDGGPPAHVGGPPPHAGPPGGPPGLSGDKPGRGRGRR